LSDITADQWKTEDLQQAVVRHHPTGFEVAVAYMKNDPADAVDPADVLYLWVAALEQGGEDGGTADQHSILPFIFARVYKTYILSFFSWNWSKFKSFVSRAG